MVKAVLVGALVAFASTMSAAQAQERITNGSFEFPLDSPTLSRWTVQNASTGSSFGISSAEHRSGSRSVYFGATGSSDDILSQTFVSNVGRTLTLSYFLRGGGPINSFTVTLNGVTLFAQTDMLPPFRFTQYTFTAQALDFNTLAFAGRNELGEFYLDDVSVIQSALAVPGPIAGAGLVPLVSIAVGWFAYRRRRDANAV